MFFALIEYMVNLNHYGNNQFSFYTRKRTSNNTEFKLKDNVLLEDRETLTLEQISCLNLKSYTMTKAIKEYL